jgi:Tfp pilus tip-associated adhesin PilY1
MTPALQRVTVFVAAIAAAAGASAQEPALPAGHWESASSETYSTPLHAVVTGAEFYLKIDVSNDGSFRGEWGEYYCSGASVGAYGFASFPCRFSGNSERVSGRFGPGRQGVIDLGRLGRSAFSWAAPAAGELAIDLPKDWRGDAILWRARMTRDGKGKPTSTTPPGDAGPLLSANALYREFNKDSNAALGRHAGKTLVLEGRRGTLIELSDGGAAIHIADGFTSRALVLVFRDLREVSGISEGAQFRFRCTVESFDYLYVHLEGCSIVP